MLDMVRSGDWVTRERMRLVGFGLLIAFAAGLAYLFGTANGLSDAVGRPLGTDFSNVYAAGTLVLDGQPQAPFDPALQYAREQAIFGDTFYGWHYPPFFLSSRRRWRSCHTARPAGVAGRDARALSAALAPSWSAPIFLPKGRGSGSQDAGVARAVIAEPPTPLKKGRAGRDVLRMGRGRSVGSCSRSRFPRCSSNSATAITASSPPP